MKNRRLSVFILALLLIPSVVFGGAGSVCQYFRGDPALKGCWSLDGHARDESGNANHGTVTGAISHIGRFRGGYYFDGGSSYITIPNTIISNSSKYSIITWVYPRTKDTQFIYSEQNSLNSICSVLSAVSSSGFARFQIHNGSAWQITTSVTPLKLNCWTCIILTFSTDIGFRLYLHGILNNSNTTDKSVGVISKNPCFGCYLSSGVPVISYYGSICESAILNRDLSPAEVSQYYQWATSSQRKWVLYFYGLSHIGIWGEPAEWGTIR